MPTHKRLPMSISTTARAPKSPQVATFLLSDIFYPIRSGRSRPAVLHASDLCQIYALQLFYRVFQAQRVEGKTERFSAESPLDI